MYEDLQVRKIPVLLLYPYFLFNYRLALEFLGQNTDFFKPAVKSIFINLHNLKKN